MTLITFDNLSKADGSALIDQDDTIVQATVFGPVDVSQSKVNYEEAIVEILYKPKVSIPSNSPAFDQIRELENRLRWVFKDVILTRLHPRTSISILVQEIYNGGSLFSAMVNAICCALIDAGVPMRCPVAGVTIKLEDLPECSFEIVYDNNLQLVTFLSRGLVDEDSLRNAVKLGEAEAMKSLELIRDKVRERFT